MLSFRLAKALGVELEHNTQYYGHGGINVGKHIELMNYPTMYIYMYTRVQIEHWSGIGVWC